jgi:signal transduction histidine kinase/PAS domain-containing protein
MRRTGGASFTLLDRSGRIAFRSPALERPGEERDALAGDPLVRRALAGEEAAGVFAADGRVGAAVPVALTGWVASASRADREAFGAVRIEFVRAGAVALVAALLALAAAARVGGRISASLRRLEAHAEALGRGERVAHPASTAPEIARLAGAYAGMAERLRASREAFAALFDSVPVGIVVLDGPSLRARWANRAYLAFLDEPHRSHGVEGKRLPEFVPGAEAGGLVRVLERVARGDIPHVESEYRHEGFLRGATFWRWSVRAIPSTDHVGAQDLLLVMSEITEQVVARRRIEADRRRLRVLHDAGRLLADALEPAEAARRLARFVVPALADFCSIDAVSEEGALRPLALAHADPEREARALAAGEGGAPGRESLAWRAISERRTLDAAADGRDPREALAGAPALAAALDDAGLRSIVAVPLVAGGEVVGALTLATAASGRVLDDEDVRLAEDLATGGAQALRNARLFADVQRAVQNRDEVLWVVSHDLRTPLGAVTLGARAITGLPDEPDSLERARGTARRILSAGTRMGRLIGDLLDLARLRQGRIAVTRAAHAPAALLQDAADESRGAAHEKGLELRWSVEPDLPDVACDHGRILQVLGNLVSNAIQATERGEVRLSARRAGGEILFTVRDTGPGIPEADRTRIFERFRRGAGARYVGTGLGLAIAREIVEAHGGQLWVDPAPGPGATLHFTLPVARTGAPPGSRQGERQAPGGEAQAGGAAAPGAAAGRWPSTVP